MHPVDATNNKYGFHSDCVSFKEAIFKDHRTEESLSMMELIKPEENLEDVEKVVGECSALFRAVKEANEKAEPTSASLDNLAKVDRGLEVIRQRLLTCANRKLSQQEFLELGLDELKQGDPSVEFFGLEWTSVFSKCYSLGLELRLLKAGLEQNRLCTYRLRVCFSLINQLTNETEMHVSALDSGRLRSNDLNRQRLKEHTSVGRTGSFKQLTKEGPQRRPAKYQGSRTDSALATSGHRKREPKKLPSNKNRRKSSFMDSFSNIFKAGFNL